MTVKVEVFMLTLAVTRPWEQGGTFLGKRFVEDNATSRRHMHIKTSLAVFPVEFQASVIYAVLIGKCIRFHSQILTS